MRRQPITTLEHAGLLVTFEGRWAGGISDVRLIEPAPADVDPDEALAKVLCSAFWGGPVTPSADNADWTNVARAAREHIEANQLYAYRPVAAERDKAEADLARMTDARDRHSRAADKWCNLYADKCEEIESVQAKADRYDALRADVDDWASGRGTKPLWKILDEDTERAES